MRFRTLSLLAFWIAAVAVAKGEEPDRQLLYKTVGDTELRLHAFDPDGLKPGDQRPAVVFFFGGGWVGGSPVQFYQQARDLADLGIVAFSAEYRVKGRNKTTPFECVKDGKSAIRWVRGHADELGIDPKRIIAAGGSAGGHVAICTGMIEGVEEDGENPEISSAPNLIIAFNPVLDTTEKGYGESNFKEGGKTALSPVHHVREGIVPTIVFHGTKDTTVPFENASRFARLMKEAGNECELVPFEGEGHGFFNGSGFRKKSDDVSYNEVMRRMVGFMEEHGYLDATENSDSGPE